MNNKITTVKELREKSGLTQRNFAKYFEIPLRTIENWEAESNSVRKPPIYLIELMYFKLKNEGII